MSPSPARLRRAAIAVPCCIALSLGGAAAHHPLATGPPERTTAAAPGTPGPSRETPRPDRETPAGTAPSSPVAPAPTRGAPHTAVADRLLRAQPAPSTTHRPSVPSGTPSAAPGPRHTSGRTTTPPAQPTPSQRNTQPSAGTSNAQMADAVLRLLNSERAEHALPPLRMNAHLISSAHSHNLSMAAQNTMAHQVGGEAPLETRISRAGYGWSAAGENIGWNTAMTTDGALHLERMMYAEGAGGGHYENIVSGTYRDVGIDVHVDQKHHKLWLTEDFGRAG